MQKWSWVGAARKRGRKDLKARIEKNCTASNAFNSPSEFVSGTRGMVGAGDPGRRDV